MKKAMAMSRKFTHSLIIVIALCFILWVARMPLAISIPEINAEEHIKMNLTNNSTTTSTTNSTENSTSNTPIAVTSQNATA